MSPTSSSELLAQIWKYVEENSPRFTAELSELCRFTSVSAEGRGLEPTARWLVRKLTALGAEVQLIETPAGGPLICGVLRGEGDRALLFYNYYDVVSEGPGNLWLTEAFSPMVREGRLFARGADSNKGNLLARLHAVEAFVQGARRKPPVTVKFILDGGEEIGSPYLPEVFQRFRDLLRADGCVWAAGYKDSKGRLQISLGTKGILYVELRTSTSRPELHSSYATLVPNPAWQLVKALNTLIDEYGRCRIDGFYENVRSPSQSEYELMLRLDFGEKERMDEWRLKSFLSGVTGAELWAKHLYEPTCTICGLSSGYAGVGMKTILPSEAAAKIDFRLVPGQRANDIEERLRHHLEVSGFGSLQCTILAAMDPSHTPLDAWLVEAALQAANEVYRKEPVILPLSPVSGFAGLVESHLGAPTISAGVGDARSNPHGPNESIALSDYIEGVLFVAALLIRAAGVEGQIQI